MTPELKPTLVKRDGLARCELEACQRPVQKDTVPKIK
jgi:hypothetical protein